MTRESPRKSGKTDAAQMLERQRARKEFDANVTPEATWLAFMGLATAVGAALLADGWLQALGLVLGVVVIAAAAGIWRASEGARIVGGVAALVIGVVAVAALIATSDRLLDALDAKLLHGFGALATGGYLLSSSTKATFARVREVRALVSQRAVR